MAREAVNDARARKRERDKQNQRQRRRRERDAFEELQRKNELLEQQVKALRGGNHSDVQSLSDTVQQLEKSNKELKEKLEAVNQFVKSWNSIAGGLSGTLKNGTAAPPNASSVGNHVTGVIHHHMASVPPRSQMSSPAGSTPLVVASSHAPAATDYFPDRRGTSIPSDYSASIPSASPVVDRADLHHASGNLDLRIPEHRLRRILEVPKWARIPSNLSANSRSYQPWFDPFTGLTDKLRVTPSAFERCVPYPSPLDLLYGDSGNELANGIAAVTYPNPSRRTEKLAYQILTYNVARWKIQPTEENFSRIPSMLQPTTRQVCVPHAPIIDFMAWPTMRDNMIQAGTKYCRPEVFGLLFVTCRLKNTPNGDWIIRTTDESGVEVVSVDPAFISIFEELENWVILDRFWKDYPELVAGLDPAKFMISEQDLV